MHLIQIILYLLFSLFIFTNSFGQEIGRLRGFVTNSANGEALPFSNVYLEELGSGSSANERGLYLINHIPAGKTYTVKISYVGFLTKTVEVVISPNKITELNVELVPAGVEIQTIEKIGEKTIDRNETDIGLERISVKSLQSLPKSVETDVLRSLQYVAGVRTTGDVTAQYYVRGGTSDQNLVLLNGITIYNPFHALGLFSVVDPEMINSVEFYKGGHSAEFGNRISSVLSVISKDGNKNKLSATASASFLTGKFLFEGPIPNGSFMLTGRKSLSNDVLKNFMNEQNLPIDFYDYSFKVNYSDPNIIKNGRFYLFGFFTNDNLDDKDPLAEDYKWKNDLIGFEWIQIYDVPLYSRLGISTSSFTGKVIPNKSEYKPKTNEIDDMTLKFDFNYVWSSKDELSFGFEFKSINTKLFQTNAQGALSDIEEFAANFSIYGKYKLLRFENFGVDIGSRINLTGLNQNSGLYFEPRLSLTYRVFPFLSLKGSAGLYQQEVATISDENDIITLFEPWTILPDYLEPTRAFHISYGADWYVTEDFLFKYEGYYKETKNLAAVNENKIYDYDPDLLNGDGWSYGSEFTINHVWDRLRTNLSYTLSWTYKEVEDWIYYPNYDSRHTVNIGCNYNLGAGWSANILWTYNTGLPFTPILGYYNKYYPNNFFEVNPGQHSYQSYTVVGDINSKRLTDYHRLDFTLAKKIDFDIIKIELDASIINVYDRKNVFYYERDTGEIVYMLPLLPTASIKVSL